MKREFALLFALTFMVSGMAAVAEEAVVENAETVETAETAQTKWTASFEDGEWLSVPEWNAEVYMPAGWALTEVNETGFIAADESGASTMTVAIEAFAEDTVAENGENEEADESVELSAFESYLMGLGQEYELALMGDTETAVFAGEESVEVQFVMNGQLVTMTFAPADEGSVADSALTIAETFYMYDTAEDSADDDAQVNAELAETEAAAE